MAVVHKEPGKLRIIAIVSKGKQTVYLERPASEWESITSSNAVGEDHKRRFKGSVISAYLVNADNTVIATHQLIPVSYHINGIPANMKETLFPDEGQL